MSSSNSISSKSNLNSSLKLEPYHHGNLRQTLVQSALDIIEKDGIDALSLREVARRAKVSPAAPYHHFKDKTALLDELSKISLIELAKHFKKAISKIENPLHQLNQIGVTYVLFAFEHPNLFKLMYDTEQTEQTDPAQAVLLEILRECVSIGCIQIKDEKSLQIAAIRSWALVHGLATLIVNGPLSKSITTKAQVIELTQTITSGEERIQPLEVALKPKTRSKKH